MRILLTGATGFIGKHLSLALLDANFDLKVAVRQKSALFPDKVKQFIIGDLSAEHDWTEAIKNTDCIIHLAAKAHVLGAHKAKLLVEFRQINTFATLNLAKCAADSGVGRFIFISSIGVNGNSSSKPFTENDAPNPQDPYALSKYEAEQGLFKIAQNTHLQVVVIRPPLVYGKNAPGNFARLIRWASRKILLPLPLGAVKNSRSLLALDNLIDFIIICTTHKKAANEIFLICDGQDLSTPQLLKKLAFAANKKPWLLPVPTDWLVFITKLFGKRAEAIRLLSSLQIDNKKARLLLGWEPKISIKVAFIKIMNNEKNI